MTKKEGNQRKSSGDDNGEEGEGEMEDKMMAGENRKTRFPLSHPPLFTPSPNLPFSPQESVHSSLLYSCFPLLLIVLFFPPPPPPPLSMWMALYHSASLSLSLSVSVCAVMWQVRDMHR